MVKKLLGLLCILMILCCGMVYANDNNTTSLESLDEDVIADESQVTASGSGIRNITFSDGYNGYCINLTKDHADEGSEFTPRDTSHAMNNKYNTPIGNYLKILFVDFYDTATSDSDATSEVIWDFSDRYYLDSTNPITQAILKLADGGRVIADHGETKKIDDKTEAVFDFEVFDPLNDDLQNYFGYKITLKDIENDTSQSNDTDIANETDTNTTDETDTNKTDNETDTNTTNETDANKTDNETDSNITDETNDTEEINETVIGIVNNETGIGIIDYILDENITDNGSNEDSFKVQDISNATGNPIVLLILALSIFGFGIRYRKD